MLPLRINRVWRTAAYESDEHRVIAFVHLCNSNILYQRRVNGHRKSGAVDPFRVGGDGQNDAVFHFLDGIGNCGRGCALGIFHVRRRNAVDSISFAVTQNNTTVLLHLGRQALQLQKEVVAVTVLLLPHNDLLFQVIAECRVAQIYARVYIPIQDRRRQLFRHKVLSLPAIFLGKAHGRRSSFHLYRSIRIIVRLQQRLAIGRDCIRSVLFRVCQDRPKLGRLHESHGNGSIAPGSSGQAALRQVSGEGRDCFSVFCRDVAVCPLLECQGVVDVLPLPILVRIMDRHTVGNGEEAAV